MIDRPKEVRAKIKNEIVIEDPQLDKVIQIFWIF
jgi:hypothetical protein